MEELNLFSSKIWSTKLNLDKEILLENLYNHANNTPCVRRSNIGGYQGHNFDYEPLNQAIVDNIPEVEDIKLGDIWVKNWININVAGDFNARHTHANGLTLLSSLIIYPHFINILYQIYLFCQALNFIPRFL